MKILPLVRAEFSRVTASKMGRLSLFALMTVPLFYGGLYLWGNQDPYSHLDKVPAAIVVSDTGATVDGSTVNYGKDAATALLDDGTFGWKKVTAAQAAAGVKKGTYDFSITFPAAFSADLTSSGDTDPTRAQLVLTTNDTNSYLSTTLAKQAAATVRSTIAAQVGESATKTLLSSIGEIRTGLVDASSGSSKLASGAEDAADGADQLETGAATASSGAASLASGSAQLASGAGSLATGTAQVASGAKDLRGGTKSLATGAKSLSTGTAQLSTGADSLKTGTATLSSGAATLSSGTASLSAGAATLKTGTANLSSGASTLSNGLATLDASTATLPASAADLDSGAQQVSDGASDLSSGLAAYAALHPGDPLLAQLVDGARDLSTGATAVAAGTSTLNDHAPALAAGVHSAATGAASLASGATDAASGAATLASGAADAASGAKQVASGASDAATGASTLASGATTAASGAKKLSTGATTAATGAKKLSTGATSAASGASDLADGASTASTGATKLASGTADLATGASSLADGTETLATGATKLNTSLKDGVAKVPATTTADRNTTATAVSDPLAVKQNALSTADNYGAGLAPFFIALSAWIGMYALFLMLRPLSRRALSAVRKPIRTMLAGWITPAVLGAVQMVALFLLLTLALHVQAAHPVGLLLYMMFTSITYAAVVLALNALLGSVGQFLGLVLMIVQLVTAGGTFPWQTLPAPLAAVHEVLPMAHAVDGIRSLMYGGSTGQVWMSLIPMALWLVAGLAATAFAAHRQSGYRSLREVRPAAIGG